MQFSRFVLFLVIKIAFRRRHLFRLNFYLTSIYLELLVIQFSIQNCEAKGWYICWKKWAKINPWWFLAWMLYDKLLDYCGILSRYLIVINDKQRFNNNEKYQQNITYSPPDFSCIKPVRPKYQIASHLFIWPLYLVLSCCWSLSLYNYFCSQLSKHH